MKRMIIKLQPLNNTDDGLIVTEKENENNTKIVDDLRIVKEITKEYVSYSYNVNSAIVNVINKINNEKVDGMLDLYDYTSHYIDIDWKEEVWN